MAGRILIADDEKSIRSTFYEFLYNAGYRVSVAATLSNCVKKMQEDTIDLLFQDISFGVDNEIESIQALKEMQPDCKIVIITGNPRLESLVEAKRQGAFDFLAKPLRESSLLHNVKKVLAHYLVLTPHPKQYLQKEPSWSQFGFN